MKSMLLVVSPPGLAPGEIVPPPAMPTRPTVPFPPRVPVTPVEVAGIVPLTNAVPPLIWKIPENVFVPFKVLPLKPTEKMLLSSCKFPVAGNRTDHFSKAVGVEQA